MNFYKLHSNPEKLNLYSELSKKIDETGALEFRNADKLLHSVDDKPSFINVRGTKVWHKDGRLHRDGDLPAVIYSDGRVGYAKHDQYHRDGDKPAIIDPDGYKEWWINGKLIRRYVPTGRRSK